MVSRVIILLLTFGLVYSTDARPVSHEDAEKQAMTVDDLISDKELKDLYKSLFPSSSEMTEKQGLTINGKHLSTDELNNLINDLLNPSTDAKEQGIRIPIDWGQKLGWRVPYGNGQTQADVKEQGIRIDWGQKQGRRVPYGKEQTQAVAKEQGIRIDWGQKQGKRVPYGKEQTRADAKEQGIRIPINWGQKQGRRVLYGNGQTQGKTAEKQEWSITLPDGSTYKWPVQEQGLFRPSKTFGSALGWGQEQGRRVPFAKGQSYLDALKRIYGIDQRSENAKKEGVTITLPDGNTLEWGEKQGIRGPFGKVQTLYTPYFGFGRTRWSKKQAKKASSFAREQSTTFDDVFRNMQKAWRWPSAKQQVYYPSYLNGYAKKQTYFPHYPFNTGYAEKRELKELLEDEN